MILKFHFRTLCRTLFRHYPLVIGALIAASCSVDPENRPSPLVLSDSKVNEVTVKLSYSSPSVRERKIFGYGDEFLEPYGELWRTGANKATSIYFDKDVLVDYLQVDSGTYSIFTIPKEEIWTVIFNKDWDQWGSYDYNESDDVLRLEVPTATLSEKEEKMKLFVRNDSLLFQWEFTSWGVPLTNLP